MNRPRIPVIVALGVGILMAGVGALIGQDLPTWASFSRPVDDQRNAVAKPEVRDAVEEQVEQEDGAGPPADQALVDTIPPLIIEERSLLLAPAASLDVGRPRSRVCLIRGPPLHA